MASQSSNIMRPPRPTSSIARPSSAAAQNNTQQTNPSITSASAQKARHLSHLHSQLAQLSANLSDLENLVRMTAVQAESMRGLGGWSGGLFMAASKVLGEETIAKTAATSSGEQERNYDNEHK